MQRKHSPLTHRSPPPPPPPPPPPVWTADTRQVGSMVSFVAKYWLHHLQPQPKSRFDRLHLFPSLQLPSFHEWVCPVQPHILVSWQTGMEPDVVFCCWRPSSVWATARGDCKIPYRKKYICMSSSGGKLFGYFCWFYFRCLCYLTNCCLSVYRFYLSFMLLFFPCAQFCCLCLCMCVCITHMSIWYFTCEDKKLSS